MHFIFLRKPLGTLAHCHCSVVLCSVVHYDWMRKTVESMHHPGEPQSGMLKFSCCMIAPEIIQLAKMSGNCFILNKN